MNSLCNILDIYTGIYFLILNFQLFNFLNFLHLLVTKDMYFYLLMNKDFIIILLLLLNNYNTRYALKKLL